jgi:transcriptional regulator with XRE-family HTH domain
MSLGKQIVKLRMQKQWKQKDLAELVGVDPRHLVRWEYDRSRPRQKAIEKLAEVLGVSVAELLSEADKNPLSQITDPELKDLVENIPSLNPSKQEALKIVLRDMLTCQQINKFNRAS